MKRKFAVRSKRVAVLVGGTAAVVAVSAGCGGGSAGGGQPKGSSSMAPSSAPVAAGLTEQISFYANGANQVMNPDGTLAQADLLQRSWSPDRSIVATENPNSGASTIQNSDGSDSRSLPDRVGPGGMMWSPDNKYFAVKNYVTAPYEGVLVYNAATLASPVVIPDSDQISWTPDGSKVTYVAWKNDVGTLRLADADGRNPRSLVTGRLTSVSFAPDGTKAAYGVSNDTDAGDGHANTNKDGLYLLDVPRAKSTRITDRARKGPVPFCNQPLWSPDGSKIACSERYGSDYAVTVMMNADGSGAKKFAANASAVMWSPDGKHLVLSGDAHAGKNETVVVAADGSHRMVLGRNVSISTQRDAWSKDGSKLVFSTNAGISVAHSDGSGVTQIYRGTSQGAKWIYAPELKEPAKPIGKTFEGSDSSVWALPDGVVCGFDYGAGWTGVTCMVQDAQFDAPGGGSDGCMASVSLTKDGINGPICSSADAFAMFGHDPSHEDDWGMAAGATRGTANKYVLADGNSITDGSFSCTNSDGSVTCKGDGSSTGFTMSKKAFSRS